MAPLVNMKKKKKDSWNTTNWKSWDEAEEVDPPHAI